MEIKRDGLCTAATAGGGAAGRVSTLTAPRRWARAAARGVEVAAASAAAAGIGARPWRARRAARAVGRVATPRRARGGAADSALSQPRRAGVGGRDPASEWQPASTLAAVAPIRQRAGRGGGQTCRISSRRPIGGRVLATLWQAVHSPRIAGPPHPSGWQPTLPWRRRWRVSTARCGCASAARPVVDITYSDPVVRRRRVAALGAAERHTPPHGGARVARLARRAPRPTAQGWRARRGAPIKNKRCGWSCHAPPPLAAVIHTVVLYGGMRRRGWLGGRHRQRHPTADC